VMCDDVSVVSLSRLRRRMIRNPIKLMCAKSCATRSTTSEASHCRVPHRPLLRRQFPASWRSPNPTSASDIPPPIPPSSLIAVSFLLTHSPPRHAGRRSSSISAIGLPGASHGAAALLLRHPPLRLLSLRSPPTSLFLGLDDPQPTAVRHRSRDPSVMWAFVAAARDGSASPSCAPVVPLRSLFHCLQFALCSLAVHYAYSHQCHSTPSCAS